MGRIFEYCHENRQRDSQFSSRSIRKNLDKNLTYLNSSNHTIDILMFFETWLRESECDYYNIPGYSFNFVSRPNRLGGGVAIYTKHNLEVNVLAELSKSPHIDTNVDISVESLFIEIYHVRNHNPIIVCIYNPPNTCPDVFGHHLENLLHTVKIEKYGGDLNINLLNHGKVSIKFLKWHHIHRFFIPL